MGWSSPTCQARSTPVGTIQNSQWPSADQTSPVACPRHGDGGGLVVDDDMLPGGQVHDLDRRRRWARRRRRRRPGGCRRATARARRRIRPTAPRRAGGGRRWPDRPRPTGTRSGRRIAGRRGRWPTSASTGSALTRCGRSPELVDPVDAAAVLDQERAGAVVAEHVAGHAGPGWWPRTAPSPTARRSAMRPAGPAVWTSHTSSAARAGKTAVSLSARKVVTPSGPSPTEMAWSWATTTAPPVRPKTDGRQVTRAVAAQAALGHHAAVEVDPHDAAVVGRRRRGGRRSGRRGSSGRRGPRCRPVPPGAAGAAAVVGGTVVGATVVVGALAAPPPLRPTSADGGHDGDGDGGHRGRAPAARSATRHRAVTSAAASSVAPARAVRTRGPTWVRRTTGSSRPDAVPAAGTPGTSSPADPRRRTLTRSAAVFVGRPLQIGHDRLDLEAGRRQPAAAQPDEGGGPLHPLGEVVDVDGLALEAGQDRLQLGQRLGVPEGVELAGVGPSGSAPSGRSAARLMAPPGPRWSPCRRPPW